MVLRTIVKARYRVPQKTPTPANTMTAAISEANGQLPSLSVNSETPADAGTTSLTIMALFTSTFVRLLACDQYPTIF